MAGGQEIKITIILNFVAVIFSINNPYQFSLLLSFLGLFFFHYRLIKQARTQVQSKLLAIKPQKHSGMVGTVYV